MKIKRHSKILELIKTFEIETQEELSDKLRDAGYEVTQATVSRDIKQLRLIKVMSKDGKYKYSAMGDSSENVTARFHNVFSETAYEIAYANNMVVVKCYSGMANAAAAAIEAMNLNQIVGTLAGDDTIFIIAHNEENAVQLTSVLQKALKQ